MLLRSKDGSWAGGVQLAALIATLAVWPTGAQNRFAGDVPSFRADSTLVLVPVTVVDRRGSIVNGLSRDAFTLTENGVRQPIRSFSQEDVPVSMGIVLDLSGSMQRVLGTAKESLRALLKDSNPADEFFLNGVSTRPRPYSGFTSDLDEILSAAASGKAGGSTALIDTIYASLQQLRSGAHTRKALVVISDGMDNHSRYSREELLRLAAETDAQVYSIAVGTASQTAKPIELAEERRGALLLEELAAKTGGIGYIIRRPDEIEGATATIGHALRNQYAIGYVPGGNSHAGLWRSIKVRVAVHGMKAYARSGYRLDTVVY